MERKPIKVFKLGLVSVSVWAQQGSYGPFCNATVTASFKRSGSNQWEYGQNLKPEQMVVASRLLLQAADFIQRLEEKPEKASDAIQAFQASGEQAEFEFEGVSGDGEVPF